MRFYAPYVNVAKADIVADEPGRHALCRDMVLLQGAPTIAGAAAPVSSGREAFTSRVS